MTMMLGIAIALISTLATLAVVVAVGGRLLGRRAARAGDEIAERVRRAIEDGADGATAKIREAVRSGLDEAVAEALPRVREEVAAGVGEGADRVLPVLRDEVRGGVEEAIVSAVTGGVVGKAGDELARRTGELLGRVLRGPDKG
ncbi:MAG: hypothetical protein MUC56_05740 [Thermoanaerobaculales bacterium]|jgi:hypothetical protein|nr:hypothetical protein [Thermoanaerobaculales bacterium]